MDAFIVSVVYIYSITIVERKTGGRRETRTSGSLGLENERADAGPDG